MTSVAAPMCMVCARYRRNANTLSCDAFPGGIPTAIVESRADHRKPYPGDGGKRFVIRDEDRNTSPENLPGLLGGL